MVIICKKIIVATKSVVLLMIIKFNDYDNITSVQSSLACIRYL